MFPTFASDQNTSRTFSPTAHGNALIFCSLILLIALIAVLLYVMCLLHRYANSTMLMEPPVPAGRQPTPGDVSPRKETLVTLSRVCDDMDYNLPPMIVCMPSTPPPEYESISPRSLNASPLPSYDELMLETARSSRQMINYYT